MNVTLPIEQQKWLEAEVAAGRFGSIDEALAVAVADLMAIQDDDLAWAKPYVDQARASIARGAVMSGAEFFKRLEAKLESLRARRRGSSSPRTLKQTPVTFSPFSPRRPASRLRWNMAADSR
jgi:antitoxin ParD1/3/4